MTTANSIAPRPDGMHPPATESGRVAGSTQSSSFPVPYLASPIPDSLAQRRILLLSYHFPPSPAAGALRWQKLAGLVAERGWGLDVVALDPGQLKRQEPERYGDLPAGTRVFGVREGQLLVERLEHTAWLIYGRLRTAEKPQAPQGQPTPPTPSTLTRDQVGWQLWSLGGWRRAYYAWVRFAHDRAWAQGVASLARRVVRPGIHRVVISCGPPHLAHEAGRLVAEATRLPLVVDMRDPWSLGHRFQEYAASPLRLRLMESTERRIIDRSSLVVMNTPPAAEGMARAYPGKRVISVLNGYDEEPLPPIPSRSRFIVAYTGSIYLDRDPRLVFRAAAHVVRELGLTPEQFGFEFIGNTGSYRGTTLEDIAAQEGLSGYVRTGPQQPRAKAMAFMAEASMLLSLPQDSYMAIPSKIYEYMRFPAWMLVLTEADSATDRILTGTGADVLRPEDVDGMTAVLRRRYQAFAAGERPVPVARDARLSRRHQSEVLLEALTEVTEAHRPG